MNTIKSAIPQRQTNEWCRITFRPGSANYLKYKILTADCFFKKQIYFSYSSFCCLFSQARHLRRWDQSAVNILYLFSEWSKFIHFASSSYKSSKNYEIQCKVATKPKAKQTAHSSHRICDFRVALNLIMKARLRVLFIVSFICKQLSLAFVTRFKATRK